MPYVPSVKTDGKSQDRVLIDREVEKASRALATVTGFKLLTAYKTFLAQIASDLTALQAASASAGDVPSNPNFSVNTDVHPFAKTIFDLGANYGYEGAFLGELNYAITRLIQRVPQIMVDTKQWKTTDEIRYWLYAITVQALTFIATLHANNDYGIGGVFEDIKDEYKRRVNTSYEAAQILKSGDCYDTPFYTRLIEVIAGDGNHLGYIEVMLARSEDTLHKDVLDSKLVLVHQVEVAKAAASDATGFVE
jgi:hypothetical protein